MMNMHTHISFELAALAVKPGCYRFWEQLGSDRVCMSDSKM